MAFDSIVKGVWTFNQTLEDEISTRDFSNATSLSPTYKSFQQYDLSSDTTNTRYGIVYEANKPFTAGSDFTFTLGGNYQLSIGFWWNSPDAIGFIRHASTNRITTKIGPILAKADSTIASTTETPSVSEFIISEVAASVRTNAIRFALCTTNGYPTHFFTSEAYEPGLVHVFINYKVVDSTLAFARIDINGKYGTQHSTPGIQTVSTGSLRINDIGYGDTAHKDTREDAFIADLIVRSTAGVSSADTIQMMRYGWNYIADSSLSSQEFRYFGSSYEQPSTVTTNQIFVEGGNILVARSNGELLKGTQPIWDREFGYKTPDSLKFLNISEQDADRTAIWTPDGLGLKGTKIKV